MGKKLNIFIDEYLWILVSLQVTLLLAKFFFGQSLLTSRISLHLHDTYLVMTNWLVLTPLFLFVTFIIYVAKTRFKALKSKFSDWVIIVSGLSFTVSITIFISNLFQLSTAGWIAYPPLSALGPDKILDVKPDPMIIFLANLLTVLQFIVIVVLIIKAYRMGVSIKASPDQ